MASMVQARYWAFISYSQRDVKWAQWLHKTLETYRVPRTWVGRSVGGVTIPRRLVPVFRDRDELPSTGDLGGKIREALAASHALIVICSPYAAASPWVNEEVRSFKALGRGERIFPLIIDGEPYATDRPERGLPECFPAALRFAVDTDGGLTDQRVEPLAADARDDRDGRSNACLKLIAGILGIGFDALRQREQARQRRRRLTRMAASVAAGMLMGVGYLALADVDVPVFRGAEIRNVIDRYGLSVFRPVSDHDEIVKKAFDMRSALRGSIAQEVAKVDLKPGINFDGPGVWEVAQAIAGVYRDPQATKGEIDSLLRVLDPAFGSELLEVIDGHPIGWRDSLNAPFTRAESAIWTVMALTQMIARRSDDPQTKAKFLRFMDIAQKIADRYHPLGDGGWNVVTQDEPANHHIYTTTLALHALLELRASGLCWREDCVQLDEMIRAAATWSIQAFVDDNVMPGWRKTLNDDKPPDPDLSIFVFAALARVSLDVGVELPAAIVRAAIGQLVALKDRGYLPSQQDIEYWVRYIDEQGMRKADNFPTRVFWYPWAIEALVHWLQYADRNRFPPEITTALNRSLGHVLNDVSSAMLADMSHSRSFARAETLYGIDSLR
jgi:hypothetical protein